MMFVRHGRQTIMGNYLTSDITRKMFEYLTVKEISVSRVIDTKTNTFCKEKTFWKDRVFDEYGVTKMYGESWKQTAAEMAKCNMINLNSKWVDGRTYRQLLDDTMKNGTDSLGMKRIELVQEMKNVSVENKNEMIPLMHHSYDISYCSFIDSDGYVIIEGNSNNSKPVKLNMDDYLEFCHIASREMQVIYTSVRAILRTRDTSVNGCIPVYLPGTSFVYGINTNPNPFLLSLIDPIVYVMQFSLFSSQGLAPIHESPQVIDFRI